MNIVKLLVDLPFDTGFLNKVCAFLANNNIKFEVSAIIKDEKDFTTLEIFSEDANYEHVTYLPYFNGSNSLFFEKNIFSNKDDLLSANIDKNEIYAKEEVNFFDFGKISILSNGDTYANVNLPKIGNIYTDSLGQMLVNELKGGESWRRIRNMTPCINCNYKILCPSPSSYDFAFNKSNLCSISCS